MLNKLIYKLGLTKKISRERINSFVKKHASKKKTLIIGGANGEYKHLFPNSISIDIVKTKDVDIVADVHNLSVFKNKQHQNKTCNCNTQSYALID